MLPKFDYFGPQTLQETIELLDKHGRDAKLLAGGTDLIVSLRAREQHPKSIIDIKGVKELHELSFDEKRGLTVGAAVNLNRLIHYDAVSKNYPLLGEAVSTIGDYEIRNRATLVGNICNGSPAADSAPALLVLDANVSIASRKGKRTVPLREFHTGVKKTVLASNELATSINVPTPPEGYKGGYLKGRRTVGEDLTVVGVGGLVAHGGKSGNSVRLAYASVAPTPVRAFEAEKIFESNKPLNDLLDQAMPLVRKAVSPISDVRGGKDYRANLVEVLTRRLLRQLWGTS
ncbi:MAG TPA: xanthine dehydrogenase family protein subunit M [Candidatus Acidoferrum sp.]|nr:xanthine dehydrogenase family protein subunit M [Candidatus Acidoferrum sp.]